MDEGGLCLEDECYLDLFHNDLRDIRNRYGVPPEVSPNNVLPILEQARLRAAA